MAPLLFLAGAAGLIGGGLAAFAGSTARKVEKAVPQDGTLTEVNGDTLHYVDKGSGPAIVMIHGLGGQMRNFARAVVDDLARDHRVILLDRPGSGYSVRAPGASAGLAAQAKTVAAFIEQLGLEEPTLVGHSLGGALSLAVALNHPEVVGRLALIAPLTQVVHNPPAVFKGLAIPSPVLRRTVSWTVATPMGILKGQEAVRQIFAPEPVPESFAVEGGGLLTLRPDNFYNASSDLVAVNEDLPGLVERYASLKVPVSILYGREDAILDYALHGEATAKQIPDAEIEVIEGGHMVPFTQAEPTIRFIRRAAGRGGSAGGAGQL